MRIRDQIKLAWMVLAVPALAGCSSNAPTISPTNVPTAPPVIAAQPTADIPATVSAAISATNAAKPTSVPSPTAQIAVLPSSATPQPTIDVQATVIAAVAATNAVRSTDVPKPALATIAPIASSATAAPKPIAPTVAVVTPGAGISLPSTSQMGGADKVIAAFKAAGLPIGETVIFTDENDPNKLLGRPNQYIGKATWRDKRITDVSDLSIDAGGGVEIFATLEALKPRKMLLDETSKIPFLAEYVYQNGTMLLRLSHKLTPSQAKSYADVFAKL